LWISLFSLNIIHFILLTPFTYPLDPCLLFIAESRKYHAVVVLLHNDKWLKNISTKFHQVLKQCSVFYLRILWPSIFREIWRHCNGSPLLCPINATSSSSYVFRLQYPRVLQCRIVPIQNLKILVALERKKPSITLVLSESQRLSNLKVLVGYMTGGEYFHEMFVRHDSNLTKYIIYIVIFLWFMIKTINICVFLSSIIKIQKI
jgi:hypothetical protein